MANLLHKRLARRRVTFRGASRLLVQYPDSRKPKEMATMTT
jgi:hypothetical protein